MPKLKQHKVTNKQKNTRKIVFSLSFVAVGILLLVNSFALTPPSVYYGVFNEMGGGMKDVTSFEAQAGKNVAIVNTFHNWGSNIGFPANTAQNIRSHGSIPLLTWEPWAPSAGVNQPTYSLNAIISGKHDAYIRQWAQGAKAWGQPFFLRFAHEMNGNWYPWSEQVNGNKPGEYVAVWQKVHTIFKQEGVTNATWVWCVNKQYTGSADIAQLYPGDGFVDWVSFDAYNRGTQAASGTQYASSGWQTFPQLVGPTYKALTQLASGKPIMLAEVGTVEQGGSKADWFTKTLKYELKANYPRIKAVLYFNLNKIYDNRITTSTSSQAAFADGIKLSYYASSDFSNTSVSPIPPFIDDETSSDTMAPYINIQRPAGGQVKQGSRFALTLNASDKSGIKQIDVYIDGKLFCTEKSTPYVCYWTIPSSPKTYTIEARALDLQNNASKSSITVTSY